MSYDPQFMRFGRRLHPGSRFCKINVQIGQAFTLDPPRAEP